jgi:hypothetical protein
MIIDRALEKAIDDIEAYINETDEIWDEEEYFLHDFHYLLLYDILDYFNNYFNEPVIDIFPALKRRGFQKWTTSCCHPG